MATESPAAHKSSHKKHHGTHHVECPGCGEKRAVRVHRSGAREYFASMLGRYPYLCGNCKLRFQRIRKRRLHIRIERWSRCPNCGYMGVNPVSKDRVPRTIFNYWCRIVGIPSFRCPECRTKYFSIRPRKKIAPSPDA